VAGVINVFEGIDQEEVQEMVRETEEAIQKVLSEGVEIPLAPRSPALRRMQHRIIDGHHLAAQSSGKEPQRHLVVYPPGD